MTRDISKTLQPPYPSPAAWGLWGTVGESTTGGREGWGEEMDFGEKAPRRRAAGRLGDLHPPAVPAPPPYFI
jgi:hypothetical protein